jgi:hypothetical protein
MRKGDERAELILREDHGAEGGSGSYPKPNDVLHQPLRRWIPAALVERSSGRRREVSLVGLGLVGADLVTLTDGPAVRTGCDLQIDGGSGEVITLPCEIERIEEGRILVEFGRMRPAASVWLTRILASA